VRNEISPFVTTLSTISVNLALAASPEPVASRRRARW